MALTSRLRGRRVTGRGPLLYHLSRRAGSASPAVGTVTVDPSGEGAISVAEVAVAEEIVDADGGVVQERVTMLDTGMMEQRTHNGQPRTGDLGRRKIHIYPLHRMERGRLLNHMLPLRIRGQLHQRHMCHLLSLTRTDRARHNHHRRLPPPLTTTTKLGARARARANLINIHNSRSLSLLIHIIDH